jgi:type III restriction enzyme
LEGFELDKQDSNIDLTRTASKMASIDLAEGRKDEYVPEYKYVDNHVKEAFAEYLTTLTPEQKINQIAGRITKIIKKIDQIPEPQIITYVKKVIKDLNSEKIAEITNNEPFYAKLIKHKINELAEQHAVKQFDKFLDKGTVVCEPSFSFSKTISPKNPIKSITKNLYIQEEGINDFEKQVINEVANLDSVVYWHRNLERGKGLLINGFINHYPDFIVKMKNGKTILIETKGEHLDGSDSQQKLLLGEKWASKAGDDYRYFMVFKTDRLEGAITVAELIERLKDMF